MIALMMDWELIMMDAMVEEERMEIVENRLLLSMYFA